MDSIEFYPIQGIKNSLPTSRFPTTTSRCFSQIDCSGRLIETKMNHTSNNSIDQYIDRSERMEPI